VITAVLLAAGCTSTSGSPSTDPSGPATSTSATTEPGPSYDAAVSAPREDSYYPAEGDPGFDALHYQLDLTWRPATKTLDATAAITFRAAATADHVRLDLLRTLTVSTVTVDGAEATWRQTGNDLVVDGTFEQDSRHLLTIEYAGRPRPVPAPTTRSDFNTIGWNTLANGEAWAMQEPFGAFTWYPANDQPSDKAFYDLEVTVPKRWVGISNGELVSNATQGADRVMTWHLSQPAATYLMTIAIGDYMRTRTESKSGVPIDFWTRDGDAGAVRSLRAAPRIMTWIERRLGPYPFDSLGYIVVPSRSGMETQTMITLGDTDYTTSPEVIQHETVHQWYGDLVTPTDWRDVWMNEGMTMFLQMVFEADREGVSIDQRVADYAPFEIASRAEAGPPGAYDKATFGEGNIYFSPALMWNALRHTLGDQTFWRMVRAWPREHAYGNATRAEYYQWLVEEYGVNRAFLDAWIMGRQTPGRKEVP